MELPDDLRLISLKYAGSCRACATSLKEGERAHWSPSTKKIWCVDCAGGGISSATGASVRATGGLRNGAGGANPNAARERNRDSEPSRTPWQRLCRYAQRCIEAEAAKSLVPCTKADSLWFIHSGEESLVVGQSDSIPSPGKLSDELYSHAHSQDRRSIVYGWPAVVVVDRDHVPKVAPLFSVQVEPERESDDEWRLHATVEPEFNLAITASGIFDPSITEEISDLLGNGLPFGDAKAFADLAGRTACMLGLEIRSPLDPGMLDSRVAREPGIYNAAISVVTEASGYNVTLLDELGHLQTREDWATTAAAQLVPDGFARKEGRRPPSAPLAAPLVCNQSQEETLERLRRDPLTIVTGPPGTGKTQLVVNAVTNAWMDGDKVLVTSTNNAAVDVAVDRAERDVCVGLLMRTGNRAVREQVPGRIAAASDRAENHAGDQADARAWLTRITTERERLLGKLARLDELDAELLHIAEELERTRADLKEATKVLWAGMSPPEPSIDSRIVERRARRLLRAWFFRRFRARRLCKRLGCVDAAPLEEMVTWARLHQCESKLTCKSEVRQSEFQQLKTDVDDPACRMWEVEREWAEASLGAIRADAAARIRSGAHRLGAFSQTSSGGERFKRAVGNSLEYLRGWACTALSAGPNFPLEAGLFDLVIVDEASQCSLAAVLPLAYRARRLAVVGDPYQLNPIVPLGDGLLQEIAEQTGFDSDELRRRGIHHKNGSAYHAYEFAAESLAPVLLDEHYRCHPHIARWFNRTYYGDRLIVLTEVAETARRDRTILWQDVEGTAERPAARRSWINRTEAEQAVQWLDHTLESESTVGVVTPFAAQARLIEQLAERRFGRSVLDDADFVCGTAHRLQGDERDAIIVSSVLSPGMPSSGPRWVEKERNLLNVAVSRARRALIVLGHPSVGELGSATLASLRVYLREEVEQNEGDERPPANFRTDSRSEERLLSAMQLRTLSPYAKLDVEGYELDFALLEQGIRLNIEVDGDQHLDARGRQRRQDITRDRVLSNLGWTVLRIPAWRCHEEIDVVIGEIERLRNRLLAEVDCRAT